jgi:putative addiction module component (TIGR02574 family)
MSRDPAKTLKAALELPADDRAALADSLLASLDREIDQGGEAVWRIEVHRRVRELDSQVIAPVPWAEFRSRLIATRQAERSGARRKSEDHQ